MTSGASATPSGSRASHEAAERLHPSGFDPSRNNEWYNRLYVAYRIHTLGHEALTLQKQIVRMTIDSIRRGPPRMRMLRAFERDAAKVRDIAERIRDLAAIAMEARRAETAKTGSVEDEGAVPTGCAQRTRHD